MEKHKNKEHESREDFEDHIRRRHTKYNCDQCDNWYKCRKELEDHRKRRHLTYSRCSKCKDEFKSIEEQ